MKKVKQVLFLCLILLFSCCTNIEKEKTVERTAVIYNGYHELKEEIFTGQFIKDETFVYKYVSQKDNTKTVDIKFDQRLSQLYFGSEKYELTHREGFIQKELSDVAFDYYDLKEPYADGTGPILFNREYGLLAINNVYGPTIIFLNEETKDLKEQVLLELNN